MSSERRQFLRQPGPFEGTWHDDSQTHDCRISHLSPGGCFVDGPGAPPPDSVVTITVLFGDTRFTVPAQIVYLDAVQGFGARFLPSDQARALAYAMGPTGPEPGGGRQDKEDG